MAQSNDALLAEISNTEIVQEPAGSDVLSMLNSDRQIAEFSRALGDKLSGDQFARIALTTLRSNPDLLRCDRSSLLGSLMLCAQLGFEPGPLGYVWFIPREISVMIGKDERGKKQWRKEWQCNFQVGYQGWVDLARRSGLILDVDTRAVYEGDTFEYEYGSNRHLRYRPSGESRGLLGTKKVWSKDAGKYIHVKRDEFAQTPKELYCHVRLTNGGEQFHVMTWDDIMQYRSFAQTVKVWDQHTLAMAQKTIFLRLMKWLPRSLMMDQANRHDGSVPRSVAANSLELPRPADPEDEVEEPQPAEIVDGPRAQDLIAVMRTKMSEQRKERFAEYLASKEFPEGAASMSDDQAAEALAWVNDLGEEEPLPEEP